MSWRWAVERTPLAVSGLRMSASVDASDEGRALLACWSGDIRASCVPFAFSWLMLAAVIHLGKTNIMYTGSIKLYMELANILDKIHCDMFPEFNS